MPATLELAPDHPELALEDLDHLVAPQPETDQTQTKNEVEQPVGKDLRERIFDQLFAFNAAVHTVKNYLAEHPQATIDELMQHIGQYDFRPNQAEHFKDGLTELLRRRTMVKLARDTYREQEGDAYPAALCEELFDFRPQSPVTIDESDPNNLVFEFSDTRDFVRAKHPDFYFSDSEIEEIRQANSGTYRWDAEYNLPQVGQIGAAVILLNTEAIKNSYQLERQRVPALEYTEYQHDVLVHEQQHAEDHLYFRPLAKGEFDQQTAVLFDHFYEELTQAHRQIMDIVFAQAKRQQITLDNLGVEDPRSQEFINRLPAADLAIIKGSLADLVRLFETTETTVIDLLRRRNSEMFIKEELLAFSTSITDHAQLCHRLSPYLESSIQVFTKARKMFSDLYFSLPKRFWEEVGFEFRPPHQLAVLIGGADFVQKQAAFERRFAHLEEQLDAVIDFYAEQTQLGAALLEKAETEGLREQFLPLLISQPLERWPRLLDEAKRRSGVASTAQKASSAT